MQESVVAVGFELTGEVQDFSFSSGLSGLGGRGKTKLVRENSIGEHLCHKSSPMRLEPAVVFQK